MRRWLVAAALALEHLRGACSCASCGRLALHAVHADGRRWCRVCWARYHTWIRFLDEVDAGPLPSLPEHWS